MHHLWPRPYSTSQPVVEPPIQGAYDPRDWTISPKVPATLTAFDGRAEGYRQWSSRVRDHLIMQNTNWGRLLEVFQKERMPATRSRLQSMTIDGVWLVLINIADRLWAFLGAHMKDPLYQNRMQMVSGEDGNGLELWKRIYMQYGGGGCSGQHTLNHPVSS